MSHRTTSKRDRRTPEETHAWIREQVQLGTPPTYAQVSSWSGASRSTIARWYREWADADTDPRKMRLLSHEGSHSPDPGQEGDGSGGEDGKPPRGEASEEANLLEEISHLRLVRDLSPRQEAAVRLLADRKKKQEVAREVGVTPQTISAWLGRTEFKAALRTLRAQRHLLAERSRKANAQEAIALNTLTLRLLRAKTLWMLWREEETESPTDAEDVARLARANIAAAKLSMDYGGYGKTDHIDDEESEEEDDDYDNVPEEELEGSLEGIRSEIAELESRLQLVDADGLGEE